MGILTLLFALTETISDTIKEKAEIRRALEEKRRYEDIDFNNIEYVTFDGTETAYRIETEEEFDPVATQFLTEQDGWQHYEDAGRSADLKRDHHLQSLGLRVLRYSNADINYRFESVCTDILQHIKPSP